MNNYTRKTKGRRLKRNEQSDWKMFQIFLCSLAVTVCVVISIVLSVTFGTGKNSSTSNANSSAYGATVSFDWNFSSDLKIHSSTAFKETSEKACQQMSSIFNNSLPSYYSNVCEVVSFNPGSVKTTFRFLFNFNTGSIVDNSAIIYNAIKVGARNKIGNNDVKLDSIKINAQWDSTTANICEQQKPCDQICIPGTDPSAQYRCSCSSGYKLINVTQCKADDACASLPCHNSGNCLPSSASDYVCICPLPYTGKDCSQVIDYCARVTCVNGGKCISGLTNFICFCPAGYTGVTCEQSTMQIWKTNVTNYGATIRYNDISFVQDLLNSNSELFKSTSQTICQQISTIFSKYLTFNYSSCSILQFSPGSVVATIRFILKSFDQMSTNVDNSAIIRKAIITGIRNKVNSNAIDVNSIIINAEWDSSNINVCEKQKPCGQICVPDMTSLSYSCVCSSGYRLVNGNQCEAENACASNPCLNMGDCVTSGTKDFNCICPALYTAKDCSQVIDNCASYPCQNQGKCSNEVTGFKCFCPLGYAGTVCELKISNCASQPCLNQGQCLNEVTGFKCLCPLGYAGTFCELTTEQCTNGTCSNGGTCINLITGGFVCVCPVGYSGILCQNTTAACRNTTCSNNGSCLNLLNGDVYCKCLPGTTGPYCDIATEQCTNGTCSNGGTCINLLKGGFACVCPAGYSGNLCQNTTEQCTNRTCSNGGTCINLLKGGFVCVCPAGYSGILCQNKSAVCGEATCRNEGKCFDLLYGGFDCKCPVGFAGQTCENATAACRNTTCFNNGSCLNLLNGDIYCKCLPGTTGPYCDIVINNCQSNPCVNNAPCSNGINTYSCNCLAGFTGINCQTSDFLGRQ